MATEGLLFWRSAPKRTIHLKLLTDLHTHSGPRFCGVSAAWPATYNFGTNGSMKAKHVAISMVLAAMMATAPAGACSLPEPPVPNEGESEQAYRIRMEEFAAAQRAQAQVRAAQEQAALWRKSPLIFVGQVERVWPTKLAGDYGPVPSVLIRPVRWMKGNGRAGSFWLGHQGWDSCGTYGGGDAVKGEVGERFVVFARRGGLSSKAVVGSIGATKAVDKRITTALTGSSEQR